MRGIMQSIRLLILSSLWTLLLIFSAPASKAQDSGRPITAVYALEVGARSALSEYLSPIAYHGVSYAAEGEWSKVMPFAPEKAMMRFEGRVAYASMLNPAGSASMLAVEGRFAWQMRRIWRLPNALTLSVGGGPAIEAGATSLLRNSNNPVPVDLKAFIEAGAGITWRSRIGRLPILLADRLSLPILGAFFMPQYGETYYEIWLGNHSGLAHFGWPGNMAGVDNMLSCSLDFGKTALFIGYHFRLSTASACHLSNRSILHGLTIGVIPFGLGMKRKSAGIRPY